MQLRFYVAPSFLKVQFYADFSSKSELACFLCNNSTLTQGRLRPFPRLLFVRVVNLYFNCKNFKILKLSKLCKFCYDDLDGRC